MGTTAQKIQYLDGTKTLLKDTINLTGAGITNDTFRSYATKLKQGYLDILNNGIDTLYNNFPKVSGIGSNLSLTPTYKAPIKLNEIQGNTLQNGTPTPSSPVPIQSVTGLQNVTISNADNTQSNTYEVNLGNIELNKIGDYKDSIKKSNGKNLFNGVYYQTYTGGSSPYPYASSSSCRTGIIKVQPNTTYTISKEVSNRFRISQYAEYPVVDSSYAISYIYPQNEGSLTEYTLTTESTTQYLVVQVTNVSQENVRMQVELGNTALPYEPYGKVWYVEKNIGKVVLNGSETWNNQSNGAYAINISDKYSRYGTDGLLCDYFHLRTGTSTSNYEGIDNDTTRIRVWNVGMSLADFKIWLGTHNTTVLYQLATPIYEVITNTELIEDLESLYNAKSEDGTTNITITSEDLSMILNVSVLKGE